ncbi:LytR/AlgR family response regulator transcription factor [Desulfovibrio gilichinskyi]|uniref:Two component transcriptional regulator, LytTR family n=1 Tax=Desulfovibrio gilichinskyi TaxID=1519643 RepID=A0A1X7E207_9BACT|nr:LytTR family DNA-binding domain-containing protein [Desulfovibrio gilichinskyi]SMF25995.1 two component transcriptional regulator, LytTR family [Desulfovibrio gilichinskyi]
MPSLKTLILHPDSKVRSAIRESLRGVKVVRLLGETVRADEALELHKEVGYGIIFLAIDFNEGISGIELAQTLGSSKNKPGLIFIAEDETNAYLAFELGAVDYLIWPPDKDRMAKTVERISRFKSHFREIPEPSDWKESGTGVETGEETLQLPLEEEEQDRFLAALKHAWDYSQTRQPEIEKLPVNQDGRMILIPYTQIIFVEAYEDYSYVHTATQKFLTSHRLKTLEERLEPHRFFRVHRKYLVNLEMVTEVASLPGSNFMLRTAGRTRIELPISRRRIGKLKQILGM